MTLYNRYSKFQLGYKSPSFVETVLEAHKLTAYTPKSITEKEKPKAAYRRWLLKQKTY